MKKVLLIMGSFGNGHLQVSKSIKSMFLKKYKDQVEVIESDLFLQAHPNLTPVLKQLYLYSFSYFRDVYGYLYYAGKNHVDTSFYRYFSYEYLKKLVNQVKPEVIISTFPTPALSLLKGNIPVVNIITDYHLHKSWLTKKSVGYYVATNELKEELKNSGVDDEKIKVFGLPIAEKFDEKIDKDEWLFKNNLSKDKKTILLSAGAFGVSKNFATIINNLLREKENIQIVVICGKNRELKDVLESLYSKYLSVKVIGYTSNMREWMQSSDIFVTKAGGVTISEAIASNVPLILFDPIPGQEMENALYFEKKKMANIAHKDEDVIQLTSTLLNSEELNRFKENMKINYKPKAAENICDHILKLIE